jgi:spore coat polysaccharide biosynthesis protein SpsF
MANNVVVVQARMSSSRLPGKVLLPVAGAPLLERMLERLSAVTAPIQLVVATSTDAADDPIEALCQRLETPCFRGHPTDCLDRHLRCSEAYDADVVIKIPSDCPLIDPAVVDRVIGAYRPGLYDFVSNLHPPSYPDGNDVELMPIEALRIAHREASRPLEREHTTPFFWEQPERFRIANVSWESGLDLSRSHRFTIDYEEDYQFVFAVYDALWEPGRIFSLGDILRLLERRPDIYELNAKYAGVNWYRHHLDELRTVGPDDTRAAP